MQGFDPHWKDFPDYIIGITKEIWEGRDFASIQKYYTDDIIVRSPMFIIEGNESVISATMATLTEFPDRRLLGEDIIWSGTPEVGMLSSHRILSTATHLSDGFYGKKSDKSLKYRSIADCHSINNKVNDEWLIRDQGAVVRQLGWSPAKYAEHIIQQEGGFEQCARPFSPEVDKVGPYTGKGNENQWGQKYAAILQRIMGADMACIAKEYDRACTLEYPGGVSGKSFDDAEKFWLGLRSSFPSAQFTIDHQIGREDPLMAPRAALRWSLHGKHDGWGSFGRPTGAQVYIMGATHVEFGPWGLRREYTLFDEVAIWKQILLKTG